MGGDNSPSEVNQLAKWVKANSKIRTAWYSGCDNPSEEVSLSNLDYLKTGPYIAKAGPLTSPTTNQVLWRVEHTGDVDSLENITHRFWK